MYLTILLNEYNTPIHPASKKFCPVRELKNNVFCQIPEVTRYQLVHQNLWKEVQNFFANNELVLGSHVANRTMFWG